jgi:hypothetical protein
MRICDNHCAAAAPAPVAAAETAPAREHERPVLAKRVTLTEETAHVIADSWERDGLALGASAHSTGLFPIEVDCNGYRFTLYVVLAYGPFPDEKA